MPEVSQQEAPEHAFEFEEETHCYRSNGVQVPSVTQVIAGVRLFNFDGIREDVLARKAELSIEVHRACNLMDLGCPLAGLEMDARVEPFVRAYSTFVEQCGFSALLSEQRGVALCGGMKVGFCVDAEGVLNGVSLRVVLDRKCTSEVSPSMGVQLAGYDLCLGGPRRVRLVIQLFPDGKFKLHEYKDKRDYDVFQWSLALAHWKSNHGLKVGE